MKYSTLLEILDGYKEKEFAEFQRRLIPTNAEILGVRTPIMRKIAKAYTGDVQELLTFPDTYYEVTFIKLAFVSSLPYEKFILYLDKCVSFMDNWATCDCFKSKCIIQHKAEFLPILSRLFENGGEYYQRYALVTLLSVYIEKQYLPLVEKYLLRADTTRYYVHMAAAWLTTEILIKDYEYGVTLLQKRALDKKTHNKAIQKAIESFRLTEEQKDYLRSLKIK